MDVKITPARLNGVVSAVPSKSQAHRALICAALADAPTRIACAGTSEDIAATAACLSALGAEVTRGSDGYAVEPIPRGAGGAGYAGYAGSAGAVTPLPSCGVTPLPPCGVTPLPSCGVTPLLSCGESGSTFRFMLPIVCALGRRAAFDLKGRLPERPLSPLYEELVRHGCELSPQGAVPFNASGRLLPGAYVLDAGVSSQFISGLLFALPLLDGDSELRLTGRAESVPYIELTVATLESFGVKLGFDGTVFAIPGGQVYRSPGSARVEGDWSNAAFWLVAGAIAPPGTAGGRITPPGTSAGTSGGGVACAGLDMRSKQGDRAIVDILRRFGARVREDGGAAGDALLSAKNGGELRGTEIDARDIPDLVPILAVAAAAAGGTTVIRNAGRLRIKESDRLAAMADVLCGLGADAEETADGLLIRGGATLTGGRVSSYGDHRIAMAAAVAASALCSGPVVITGAEAVRKSYPGFFDDLRSLGGSVDSSDQ